jgi:Zn-dependent protease with chaperone function
VRVSLLLLAYAAAAGTVGAAFLRRSRWPARAPHLGIAAWLALTTSVLGAMALAALTPLLPASSASAGLAELLKACVLTLRGRYAAPGDLPWHVAGGGAGLLLVAFSTLTAVRELRQAGQWRARHLSALLVAGRDPELGVFVIDHPVPTVYCLPGRGEHIVVTSAALRSLREEELGAVLAHERAHLHGRHHLLLGAMNALARTLRWMPAVVWGRHEVARLLEMVADDQSARHSGRVAVANALTRLAGETAPPSTLAAASVDVHARVSRMRRPPVRLGLTRRVVTGLLIAATVGLPAVIVSVPAALSVNADYCPVDLPS